MRMGGVDKAFLPYKNTVHIAHMVQAMQVFAEEVFITRQADQADVSAYGHVLIDREKDQGPLAGLVRAIEGIEDYDWLLTAAVDADGLPDRYAQKLIEVRKPHAMVKIDGDLLPTFALIDLREAQNIVHAYQNGERALRSWVRNENCGYAQFATGALVNLNTLG